MLRVYFKESHKEHSFYIICFIAYKSSQSGLGIYLCTTNIFILGHIIHFHLLLLFVPVHSTYCIQYQCNSGFLINFFYFISIGKFRSDPFEISATLIQKSKATIKFNNPLKNIYIIISG